MPGAGLGLAIVARIAQANHAAAGVRTGPDGSTFSLAFPSHPRAAELQLG
jgi:signal transduction histidine kinase